MREKEWSSTASDEEGDQVTYGNPEHYIGGLFDQSYTEDHNRSQDVDWMNAISSSYKPLAGLKKRKEVSIYYESNKASSS